MALWKTGLLVVSVACVAVCGGDEAGSTTQQRARLLVSKQVCIHMHLEKSTNTLT